MKSKRLVCLLALLVISVPVWASDDELSRAQKAALDKSQVSLLQAISNIESASGGKVVMAALEPKLKPPVLRNGPAVYEVMAIKDDGMRAYFVDLASGKVLSQVDDWFGLLHFLTISRSEAFAVARLSLAQAVVLAEKDSGGKAFEARAKEEHDVLYYQIGLSANNKVKRIYVNATSGLVTKHAHAASHDAKREKSEYPKTARQPHKP